MTRHANPVTDVDLEPSAAHRFASAERTDWRSEVRTCSPAHCCRHQAVAPRCAEYIPSTCRHMLPDVTEIGRQGSMPSLPTESWQVMTEPTGSQPSNETNADRDASLLETVVWHCNTRAARHDDRRITEKFAIKQAQPVKCCMVRKFLLMRLWPYLRQPQQLPQITASTGCHLNHILLSSLNQKLSALLYSDSYLPIQLHFVRLTILLQSVIFDS